MKVSDTDRLPVSVAVTRTSSAPTFACSGMPAKVRVFASNESHVGSASPLASVAVYASVSPASGSAKAFAGT